MSVKRTCLICKSQYEYCPRCSNDPLWKFTFCSENCHNIDTIICNYSGFKRGHYAGYSVDKANEELEQCDLSNIANAPKDYQEIVEEIKANSKPKTTKAETKAPKPRKVSAFADSE